MPSNAVDLSGMRFLIKPFRRLFFFVVRLMLSISQSPSGPQKAGVTAPPANACRYVNRARPCSSLRVDMFDLLVRLPG